MLATLVLGPPRGILKQTRRHEVHALGAVRLVFGAKLRRRWPSWLAIVILISVVGGFLLAAVAAGRRTDSAFPRFVAAYGFDADVYATRPLPQLAKLPGVTSAAEQWCTDLRLHPPDRPCGLRGHRRITQGKSDLQAHIGTLARPVGTRSSAGIVHPST